PTVRIVSVHRFAASLLPAGPPTPQASEAFRAQQRIYEINEKEDRRDSRNCVFHLTLLKALRCLGETPHQDKEGNDDSNVKKIKHDSPRNRQQHHLMPCLC